MFFNQISLSKCDVCPNLHSEVSRLCECGKSGEFQDTWWEHWVEGYSCMSVEQVRRGVWCQGDPASYPSLDVCPLPFLWVSPLTGSHSSVHTWLWATCCSSVSSTTEHFCSIHDDTLLTRGQADVRLCHNQSCQGAAASAQSLQMSSAAKKEWHQPSTANLLYWPKEAVKQEKWQASFRLWANTVLYDRE